MFICEDSASMLRVQNLNSTFVFPNPGKAAGESIKRVVVVIGDTVFIAPEEETDAATEFESEIQLDVETVGESSLPQQGR